MRKNITAVLAIGILAFVAVACSGSFTTANISKFAFGKNDKADPAETTFNVGEKIFAVATVSNTSSKHKMKFRITYENVPGKGKGEEALSDGMDFEGARPVFLSFTAPLPGEYKIDASLADENGKEIDKKSGTVTVKGSAAPPVDKKQPDDGDDEDS